MDVNRMIRSQRINPDSLADGGSSGASRNPAAPAPAPAPKPSKDERAPDVVVDTSRLAPYFPRTSLENRPASSSAALPRNYRYNVAMGTSHSQGPNVVMGSGGGSGIALSDCPLPLQWWGHGKRSRSRREAPVPEPELTRAEVRRQKSLKYRRRRAAKAQAQARAAMPPPGSPGPILSAALSPPPRPGTLWLHGYPRINSDSLPLADGSGGSVILRPVAPTPGPTQSNVERTPLVVTDTSCLTPYFGHTTQESHMTRGRPTSSSAALVSHHTYNIGMHTYQGPNVGGGSSSDIVRTSLEQHKLWGHAPYLPQPAYSPIAPVGHHLLNNAMHTSQGSNVTGSGGNTIASPNAHVPLQWGQRKRPRSRREAPAPTPAPKPELTPAKAHVKPMVSSGAREPNLITDLSLPPRALTLSLRCSAEELHYTVGEQQPTLKDEKVMPPPRALGPILSTISPHAATLWHHSSSEEKQQPAPKGERKKQQQPQRQESIKATAEQKGKAPMVEVPPPVEEEEEEEEKAAMAARPVVPRVVTQLTHEEKEEDWLAMTGTRLPRFPHRRPEIVQKQVNNICPGEWLWQANWTRYKVKEKKSEKREGGLKGMVTDDEDSD